MLLTLAIGAIGFGGFFAVYTYLANTLLSVTHVSESLVPLVFAVFGAGMMAGLVIVPRFAHGRLMLVAGWLSGVVRRRPWRSIPSLTVNALDHHRCRSSPSAWAGRWVRCCRPG